MAQKIELGKSGEALVAEYLSKKGYLIIDRNWRIKGGEIDLIASSADGVIVFVEVKTRSSVAFGHPFEAINNDKAHRMQRLALAWLATHKCFGCDYAIDVAAVLIAADGTFTIEYRAGVL